MATFIEAFLTSCSFVYDINKQNLLRKIVLHTKKLNDRVVRNGQYSGNKETNTFSNTLSRPFSVFLQKISSIKILNIYFCRLS